jgi:hypothetical protein
VVGQPTPAVRRLDADVVKNSATARCADLEIDLTDLFGTDEEIGASNAGRLAR